MFWKTVAALNYLSITVFADDKLIFIQSFFLFVFVFSFCPSAEEIVTVVCTWSHVCFFIMLFITQGAGNHLTSHHGLFDKNCHTFLIHSHFIASN